MVNGSSSRPDDSVAGGAVPVCRKGKARLSGLLACLGFCAIICGASLDAGVYRGDFLVIDGR
jgi:hypothetical protein